MRADAQRNRSVIVSAATELFGERGLTAPLDAVARRAGIGVGTLYRHFPDREALILAVVEYAIDALTTLLREANDESADAWTALQGFMRRCASMRAGSLMSTLDQAMHDRAHNRPAIRKAGNEMRKTLDALTKRAQRDGQLRNDVGIGDILLLSMILSRREDALDAETADIMPDRFIELAIDGLRPPGTSSRALPGEPLQV